MTVWQKFLLSSIGCLGIAAVIVFAIGPEKVFYRAMSIGFTILKDPDAAAYMYALSIEKQVFESKTQAELEAIVAKCSTAKQIDPSESPLGCSHVLQDDERMMQYMIKDHAPLDVVYDSRNHVKAICASYE